MPTVKTAVSLPSELFEWMDRCARKSKIPRSRVVAEALRTLRQKVRDRKITEQLNEHFRKYPITDDELTFVRAASAHLGERLKNDRW